MTVHHSFYFYINVNIEFPLIVPNYNYRISRENQQTVIDELVLSTKSQLGYNWLKKNLKLWHNSSSNKLQYKFTVTNVY